MTPGRVGPAPQGAAAPAVRRSLALVSPPTGPTGIDRAVLRDRLTAGIAAVSASTPSGPPLVVTPATIGRTGADPRVAVLPAEPFRWHPAMVRRSLGLAAVEACVAGRFRTPVEAVAPLVDRALAHWERTGLRHYHWEPWLAGLASGGRAVVLAEAIGWATAVWSSFEWSALGPELRFGGPFDQWASPGARRVVVKARPEFRVALAGPEPLPEPGPHRSHRSASALVSVRPGSPSDGWDGELALVALACVLRTGAGRLPARVMGLWPEAGLDRCLDIDTDVLLGSVDRVVEAVASAGGRDTPVAGAGDGAAA